MASAFINTMRFIVFNLALALYTFTLTAQTNPIMDVPDTLRMGFYERNDLTPGLYDLPEETIYWHNGFLHCGLTVDSVSGHSGIVLIHLDTLGNTIWKKKHFSPAHWAFQATRMIVVNDTSIYITGIVNADGAGDYDMFLARFNETGLKHYVKFYQQPGMQWAHDLVQAPNNSLWLLSSHRNNYEDDSSRYRIWRLNEIGDTLKTYISSLKMKHALRIQPENEKIFIGGDVKSHPGRNYIINAFVDVLDTSLSLEKEISINTGLSDKFYQFIYWQGKLQVGTIVPVFDSANFNRGYESYRLGKIDQFGYYPKMAFTPYCDYSRLGAAFVINDTLLGIVHSGCENFPLLRLYNENLQAVKERGYWLGDPNTDYYSTYPFVYFVTPSKKLGGSGYDSPGSATDDYDHLFFLTESVYSMLERVNRPSPPKPPYYTQQLFYPNPFTETLNISVPQPFAGGEVVIYNLLGEEVFRKFMWYSEAIDTHNWRSGIYMTVFTVDNKTTVYKIVKVN